MPSDRTTVTELATGLGMLGFSRAEEALLRRPAEMVNLSQQDWNHLADLWIGSGYASEFEAGFANGRAFLDAADALAGRRPRLVEWTGGRRAPGDEVVPSDLRIDHVYLVSCKYLSRILHNASPARLVEHLLAQGPVTDARDWFGRVAPEPYQRLYERCRPVVVGSMPDRADLLGPDDRRRLAEALRAGWPPDAAEAYVELAAVVAAETAAAWRSRVTAQNGESVLWRLLRIGSAPYFILGAHDGGSMRLRIDTPWDWRQAHRLRDFEITVQGGGQARVGWRAACEVRATGAIVEVTGHVEVRWTHRRFRQPPEAKVYLDTPHHEVPGYHVLADLADSADPVDVAEPPGLPPQVPDAGRFEL